MTSPFEIAEIFPEEAARAVRLPRRQAGSSPQGLAVTLLADYTLGTRAWLPAAALVALLAESAVSPAGARTAISRLARRGVLEGRRQGRTSSYRLTGAAADHLATGGRRVAEPTAGAQPWDGRWTLIAFSLPQDGGVERRALRGRLRWWGYAPLYDGLWISPRGLSGRARAQLDRLTLGAMTVFEARQLELGAATNRDPLRAWDLEAIHEEYAAFVRRWRPVLPRIRSGDLRGAEAVRARTEVMDTYRRFPVLDPQLPVRLLPSGWLREPAAEVFVAVYDGLAAAAEEHVRAVAAGFADGPSPGIRAHTVADLLAGVRGRPLLTGKPAG